MDPLSITIGCVNLCNVTTSTLKRLKRLIQDSKTVDESVQSFYDETTTLDTNLRIVAKTLASTMNLVHVPNLQDCLESVNKTIDHGTKIMERLLEVVSMLDPKEASSFIRRAIKQIKVDKSVEELASLRLQMLSCNSSFQTILQAINISLSINAQSQSNPPLAESGLFASMQILHGQIEQLRIDINAQSNAPPLAKPEAEEEQVEQVERVEHVEASQLISSMQLTQSVAERVYSSATTVTNTSWIGSEDGEELSRDRREHIDKYLMSMESSRFTDTTSTTAIGLDDFRAEQLMGMLDDIRANIPRDLLKARDLSLHALDVAEDMDVGANLIDRDNIALTLSMVYVFIGGSENVFEARNLLDQIDTVELIHAPASRLNVDKLAMLCWTLYHLHDFDRAEEYCLHYINSTKALTESRENMRQFYASVVLMVYIKYCRFQRVAAEDWSRMIPNAYFKDKFLEASNGDLPRQKSHGDWRMLPEKDHVHSAALYSIPDNKEGQLDLSRFDSVYEIAAAGGFIGIIAMLMCKGLAVKDNKPQRCTFSCVQCCDTEFSSPLQVASFHGQTVALRFILRYTGSLTTVDPEGLCMKAAVSAGSLSAIRWLLDNGGGHRSYYELSLPHAIQLENVEAMEVFLNRGLDVEKVDKDTGYAPLHLASRTLSLGIISQLLDKGAQTERLDSLGCTPLFYVLNQAVSQEALDCACILLQQGADPDGKILTSSSGGKKLDGLTLLQIMITARRSIGVMKLLIDAGADPMARYSDGQTCFHRVIQVSPNDAAKHLRVLLESKKPFDLNTKDDAGRTVGDQVSRFLSGLKRNEVDEMIAAVGAKKRRWWNK